MDAILKAEGWISPAENNPRPGLTVKVLFSNEKQGTGHIKTDPNRPVWMSLYDDEAGFLSNKSWSGIHVVGWKYI